MLQPMHKRDNIDKHKPYTCYNYISIKTLSDVT